MFSVMFVYMEENNMLCHMVIDLNALLCTRSDDRTKLVQR